MAQTNPIKLLPCPEVLDRIGLKKSRLYALIRENNFPEPIKVGSRSLWPSNQVDAWIAERIAQAYSK